MNTIRYRIILYGALIAVLCALCVALSFFLAKYDSWVVEEKIRVEVVLVRDGVPFPCDVVAFQARKRHRTVYGATLVLRGGQTPLSGTVFTYNADSLNGEYSILDSGKGILRFQSSTPVDLTLTPRLVGYHQEWTVAQSGSQQH